MTSWKIRHLAGLINCRQSMLVTKIILGPVRTSKNAFFRILGGPKSFIFRVKKTQFPVKFPFKSTPGPREARWFPRVSATTVGPNGTVAAQISGKSGWRFPRKPHHFPIGKPWNLARSTNLVRHCSNWTFCPLSDAYAFRKCLDSNRRNDTGAGSTPT